MHYLASDIYGVHSLVYAKESTAISLQYLIDFTIASLNLFTSTWFSLNLTVLKVQWKWHFDVVQSNIEDIN